MTNVDSPEQRRVVRNALWWTTYHAELERTKDSFASSLYATEVHGQLWPNQFITRAVYINNWVQNIRTHVPALDKKYGYDDEWKQRLRAAKDWEKNFPPELAP